MPGATPRTTRPVSPGAFFSTEAEKTKLNWFLFEYALELAATIGRDKGLQSRLRRRGVGDREVGAFCVHYAQQMKRQLVDFLAGRTEQIGIGYEEIEAFFPRLGDKLVDQLLTKAAQAWAAQTGMCAVCPTRCISERDQRATMFDEPYYGQ